MIPVTCPRRQRCIQPRNLNIRIRRRGSIPLHINQPRRRTILIRHPQRLSQPFTHIPRSKIRTLGSLILLPLVIQITKLSQLLRFRLMLEECLVEGAVVDVHAPSAAGDTETVLLFNGHFVFVFGGGGADVADSGFDYKVWEGEGWLFHSSLSLQILPLPPPVPRNRHSPLHTLQINQKLWIRRSDIMSFYQFGILHKLF
mmetsp:Transcript_21580/g.46804  ORF Transcript_21580/g.46804 Transcript_21580/m.46804 type:complete len:200 (+) Transcript_21580:760-1359(+)